MPMPEAVLQGLAFVLLLGFLVVTLVRSREWSRLARIYPLGDERPDRSYYGPGITIGANSRGITFHGLLLRLDREPAFVPWSAVTATPFRSLYFLSAIRLTFAGAPSVEVVLPENVWANVISHRPARSGSYLAGV
jgi:hypothetical protein